MVHAARAGLGALLASAILAGDADAVTTLDWETADVPDLADEFVDNGDQTSNNGITLTFDNVMAADELPGGFVDTDGIFFGSNRSTPSVVSMTLTFNRNVRWLDYDVDFEETDAGAFQVTGPNGTSGLNDLTELGRFTFDAGTIPYFIAGEAYTLTHTIPEFIEIPGVGVFVAFSQIDEITVAPVPLPAPALLLLGGIGALAVPRRRA